MSDLERASEKIKKLESIIEKQNILIDALVEQNRSLKDRKKNSEGVPAYLSSFSVEKNEAVPGIGYEIGRAQSCLIPGIGVSIHDVSSVNTAEENNVTNVQTRDCAEEEKYNDKNTTYVKDSIEKNDEVSLIAEATERILTFLDKKQERGAVFRLNFTLKEFVTYCTQMNYGIKTEFSKVKVGCGVKSYICTNERALVYYMMENINDMGLDEVFCTLVFLSRVVDRSVQIAIVYNLLQSLDNQYLLLHLAFPILCGEMLGDSIVETTLRKILGFQLAIDNEAFYDPRIKETLRHISGTLFLTPDKEDLAKHVVTIVENMDFNVQTLGEDNIDEVASIQMVCMFLDWEWSFDFLIRKYLMQKASSERDVKTIYLMGTTASMGLVLVGMHESVTMVFDELKNYMAQDDTVVGAICYYFVKRIDPEAAYRWISANRKRIEEGAVINVKKLLDDPAIF